jgi:hypothetical protein
MHNNSFISTLISCLQRHLSWPAARVASDLRTETHISMIYQTDSAPKDNDVQRILNWLSFLFFVAVFCGCYLVGWLVWVAMPHSLFSLFPLPQFSILLVRHSQEHPKPLDYMNN